MKAARTRLTAALLAGGTTVALVLAPGTGAQAAAATLSINVGSGATVNGVGLEGMRFGGVCTISEGAGAVTAGGATVAGGGATVAGGGAAATDGETFLVAR